NPLLAPTLPSPASGGALRRGNAEVRHAIGFGVSQSGRFLRHFLELGMNRDSAGRRVFDGMFSHVAGAGKVFANHRFGMPGRTATQHEDRLYPENWFPFGNAAATDPFSGKTGAILNGEPSDPLVIETNTATEYWQKGASLVHTDPSSAEDAELPANVRVYLIAGTQHAGRPGADPRPGPCVNPRNPHSATPTTTRAPPSKSDTAAATPMSQRSGRPLWLSSRSGCYCRWMRRSSSPPPRNAPSSRISAAQPPIIAGRRTDRCR